MKILSINKFYHLKGGSERHFFELNKELELQGHKVIPWSMQSDQNEASKYSQDFIEQVDMHKFSFKTILRFFYNINAQKKLKQIIEREKPDIAHLHNIYHQFSPAIIKTLKKHNIPVVMTLHDYKLACPNTFLFTNGKICNKCVGGSYYNCFKNNCMHNSRAKSFLAMLEAYLHRKILKSYEQVDLFIAPSEYLKNIIVKSGIKEKKIKVITNFVPEKFLNCCHCEEEQSDDVAIPGPARCSRDCRASFHSARNDIGDYNLYYGRISKEKGIDFLIRTIADILDEKLYIIGSGPEFFKLKALIKELNAQDRIKMLGPKHGDSLIEYIKNAKSVVISSLWPENMPLALLESMSLGKIVIASRVGGLPEIIKNNKNGYLFDPGDSSTLKQIIAKLGESNTEIGKNARKTVEILNVKNYTKKYLKIIKNLK